MVNVKSLNTSVTSCWKYVGACMSPKGTFMYSYFPNGEVNAVFGIDDSSNGIWWYPTHRSNVQKYFVPFNWKKISYTFDMGQIHFLVTLLCAQQSMTRCLPPSPLGTTTMSADQLDHLPHITFAIRSSCIYCHFC